MCGLGERVRAYVSIAEQLAVDLERASAGEADLRARYRCVLI
jgi:hypothetical protein